MERKHVAVPIVAAVAVLLAAPAVYAQPLAPAPGPGARSAIAEAHAAGWRDPASWRRLRVGMSQGQVVRILGDPGRVTRYYGFTRWEYPDALGLRVNFDDRGRLLAWGEIAR
jgi:outer membrane protein assembly factor BamE (lipoprotein component of BamABCDE complex)